MHGPPDDPAKRKRRRRKVPTPEEREATAKRKREQRERDSDRVIVFRGRAGPAAVEAMKARLRFLFSLSEQEADRMAHDPEEISKLAFDILETVWAPQWYSLRKL